VRYDKATRAQSIRGRMELRGLNESVAIMLYIVQQYGPTPLLPTGNAALMGPMPATDIVR
jgi:hypothetical protein